MFWEFCSQTFLVRNKKNVATTENLPGIVFSPSRGCRFGFQQACFPASPIVYDLLNILTVFPKHGSKKSQCNFFIVRSHFTTTKTNYTSFLLLAKSNCSMPTLGVLIACSFLEPLVLGDSIRIDLNVHELSDKQLVLQCSIFKQKKVCCIQYGTCMAISSQTNKVVPLPVTLVTRVTTNKSSSENSVTSKLWFAKKCKPKQQRDLCTVLQEL